MIVCKQCGHGNEDDGDFCGSCGSFLEWEGERVSTEPAVVETADVAEPEAKAGIVTRVKDAILGDDAPPDPPAEVPPTEPAPAAASAPPAPAPPPPVAPAPPAPAAAAASTAAPPAPSASQPPAPPAEGASEGDQALASVAPEPSAGTPPTLPPEQGFISGAPSDARVAKLAVPLAESAAPVAPAAPPDPGRVERKPGEVAPRKRKAPTPVVAAKLRPGDLICGSCGTGNQPDRRFCRSCGASLAVAEVVKVPWYRRLFSRPKKTVAAGERPAEKVKRSRGGSALGFWRIAALVLAAGVLFSAFGPWGNPVKSAYNSAYKSVKGLIIPDYEQVRPTAVDATSSLAGTNPLMAVDGANNVFWAEGVDGDGVGEGLSFTFGEPIDLAKIIVTSGVSRKPEEFVTQPRPREIQLTFSNGATKTVELPDKPDPYTIDLDEKGVTGVQLQIISIYPSFTGDATAIAEVEFFKKK